MEDKKKVRKSATEDVLNYLKTHDGITQNKCTELFGATRLADIIFRLNKREGINIARRDVKVKTRYNRTTFVAEYYLVV